MLLNEGSCCCGFCCPAPRLSASLGLVSEAFSLTIVLLLLLLGFLS